MCRLAFQANCRSTASGGCLSVARVPSRMMVPPAQRRPSPNAAPLPPATTAVIPAPGPACPFPSPSRQAIKDVAQKWAAGTSANVTVNVCYGVVSSCTSDTDAANATNARGTQVMVTVTSVVDLSVPSLAGFSGFSLSATSTMLVNH